MVDLHNHSLFSDGFFTPEKIVKEAYNKGIRFLALTDHDTTMGISDFLETSKQYKDLKPVVGCEISSRYSDDKDLHILGYNIKNLDKINEYGKLTINLRKERTKETILKLQEIGYDIDFDRDIGEKYFITLTDIIHVLIEKKYFTDMNKARKLMTKGGVAYFPKYKFFKEPKQTIETILDCGGIPVLAHPHTLKLDNDSLSNYVKTLVDNGLKGIECFHSNSTIEQTNFYLTLAKKFNLIITGGSDHHGKPYETHKEFGMSNSLQQKIPEYIKEQFIF